MTKEDSLPRAVEIMLVTAVGNRAVEQPLARRAHPGLHAMKTERGFVLISVLLALTLLAVVVTEFAFSMRLEASMVRSYRDSVLAAPPGRGRACSRRSARS